MNAQPRAVADEMTDKIREQLIDAWTVILTHETGHDHQCTAMRRQRELIEQRSPERIAEMEAERGLRT